jgi:hypothetical protein
MPDSVEHLPPIRQQEQYSSAVTGRTNIIEYGAVKMHVLEMEDVLFHLASAMMMPKNPAGTSSTQGSANPSGSTQANNQAQQAALSGIEALALAFKQLEFNPALNTLIAAHADTSGDIQYNFSLSKDRGRNVHALLIESEDEWVDSVARSDNPNTKPDRHKIEDYQQVLTWAAAEKSWPCDPLGIDNAWGINTENAVKSFLQQASASNLLLDSPDAVFLSIKNHPRKLWPESALRIVFRLYNDKLIRTLGEAGPGMEKRRTVVRGSFLHSNIPIVPCGEAFPIAAAEKQNYRSQQNRRVEILFFDDEDLEEFTPAMLEAQCPVETKKKINSNSLNDYKTKCPIWPFRKHFAPLYIDPSDLNALVCHIKFVYFDKVKQQQLAVPGIPDLAIKAFEKGASAAAPEKEIPTETVYRNGVYWVKIKFSDTPSNHQKSNLRFEFTMANYWIYTKDTDSLPESKQVLPADFKNLSALEQFNYYDIPAQWDSRNWQCELGATKDLFETLINQNTTPTNPLVFDFDTIVLIEEKGAGVTQDIRDADHQLTPVNKALDPAKSRIKFLYIDVASGRPALYKAGADGSSSRIAFHRNYIRPPVNNLIAILFRDGFYTVGRKRSSPETDWVNKKMVVGARSARRNDFDYHIGIDMYAEGAEFHSTGDFELHYFHHFFVNNAHPISYLVSYLSISFMGDTRDNTHAPIPTDAEVKNYVDRGIDSAIDHWNRKQYFYEEETPGGGSTIIYPYYLFDERETFLVTRPAAGFNINFDDRASHAALFTHAAIADAQKAALGGRSRFLAMVCRDENGHWGPAYQWSIRNEGPNHYSLFKLNKSGGDNWAGMFTGVPVNEHGENYGAHTFAHELGHATGQPDEYVNEKYQPDPGQNFTYPNFDQFFVPYSMDYNTRSMMHSNAAPRIHHCWYPLHRINRGIAIVPLKNMLPNKKFVARLNRDANWNYTYTRFLEPTTASNFQKPVILTQAMQSAAAHHISNAPLKRISLALHDTGRDESSCKTFHAAQAIEYQAVLVIRVLMAINFAGAGWSGVHRRNRIGEIKDEWTLWNEHYRLINGRRDIKNIYIRFLPGFSSANAGADYILNLSRSHHPGGGDRIPNAGGTLTVYSDISANEIIRYMFNTALNRGDAGAIDFARTWLNSTLGSAMMVQYF